MRKQHLRSWARFMKSVSTSTALSVGRIAGHRVVGRRLRTHGPERRIPRSCTCAMTRSLLVVQPGEGAWIHQQETGGHPPLLLEGAASDGVLTVIEAVRAAGEPGGPRLHRHDWFDEIFYVVEGEVIFESGDGPFTAGPGTLVYAPRGSPHGWASTGRLRSRVLVVCTPSGLENAFRDVAAAAPDEIDAAWRVHHIEFVDESREST